MHDAERAEHAESVKPNVAKWTPRVASTSEETHTRAHLREGGNETRNLPCTSYLHTFNLIRFNVVRPVRESVRRCLNQQRTAPTSSS